MSSEDEAGSCSEEKSSKESNNYSPDEEMLYGADSNSFEVEANLYDDLADPHHQNYLQAVADKEDELEELGLQLTGEQSIDFW